MIAATISLLQERKPERITVREIGAAAGHHHRFVQAWFGSKQGLFRAAFERMIEETARNVQRPFSPRVDMLARAKAAAELMNWLMANDPDSLAAPRRMPVVDRVTEIYHEDFGLDMELSRLMAVRLVATTSAALLFGGPLGLQAGDIAALAQLEIEIGHLLAASRRSSG